MMAFGENLRREREKRNITLDVVAEATKVAARHLSAIENNQFSELPGGIFRRSFVRSYARFLGLDADAIVQQYLQASGDSIEPGPLPELPPEPKRPLFSRRTAVVAATTAIIGVSAVGGFQFYMQWQSARTLAASSHPTAQTTARRTAPQPIAPHAAVAVPAQANAEVVTGMPASAAGAGHSNSITNPVSATPATTSGVPAPANAATLTAEVNPAASSSTAQNAATAKIVLELKIIRQPAWVAVTADGLKLWETTLEVGEQRTITANDSVQVRTGNAGATEIVLNGEPQAALGPIGAVARFAYPHARPVAWKSAVPRNATPAETGGADASHVPPASGGVPPTPRP